MADFINSEFSCAWEKKGAVEVYRVRGAPEQVLKLGGNILTYVCAPDGTVLHAIPGALNEDTYLAELKWTRELHDVMSGLAPMEAKEYYLEAHRERIPGPNQWNATSATHPLLLKHPYPSIRSVEKLFFETLVGQVYAPDKDIVVREVSLKDFKAIQNSIGYI